MITKNNLALVAVGLVVFLSGLRILTLLLVASTLLLVLKPFSKEKRTNRSKKENQNESNSRIIYRQSELKRIFAALPARGSIIIIGPEGIGKSTVIIAAKEEFEQQGYKIAYAKGKLSQKTMLIELCVSAGLDNGVEKLESLKIEELQSKLAECLLDDTDPIFLILDDVHFVNKACRNWLKDLYEKGAIMLLAATTPQRSDLFISIPRIVLGILSDRQIRQIMKSEAIRLNLNLETTDFSSIQQRAGGNPKLAIRLVNEEYLGLNNEDADHENFADATPIFFIVGVLFFLIQFMGQAMSNPSLYIVGGIGAIVIVGLIKLILRLPRDNNRIR